MKPVIVFILDNWQFCLEVVGFIVLFIINLCKKRIKVSSNLLESVYAAIPNLIIQAEAMYPQGNGDLKFQFVFKEAIKLLAANGDITTVKAYNKYAVLVESYIETILNTPKKKEISNEN